MALATPIPVAVLTGFLGSGKTSLLNSLLKDEMLANACVIINEFGAVGLDHLLVETSNENVVELASGCLCCTIRGDLINTIGDLLARRDAGTLKPFNRIIIETTGLADPAPVLHAIMRDPLLLARLRLEGVITVVDAVNGWATLDAHPEALKQVAVADRIVVTKLDLLHGVAGEEKMFALIGRLRKLNPTARLLTTHRGEATAARLFTMGLFDATKKAPDVQAWLNDEALARPHNHGHDISRHDAHIRSFALRDARPISPQGLEMFLEMLAGLHGPNLLRLKGLIKLTDDPARPLAIHGVQHVFHPPVRLSAWGDGQAETRMVFIVKDIAPAQIESLFSAFTDQIEGAAMTDKTLSLAR